METQEQSTRPVELAGIWRRCLAFVIDTIILIPLGIFKPWTVEVRAFIPTDEDQIMSMLKTLGIAVTLIHFAWAYSTRGQTLGKRLLGIRVVALDGTPLNWRRGIIRTLGYLPSYLFGQSLVWAIGELGGQTGLVRVLAFVPGYMLGVGFWWAILDPRQQAWQDKIVGTCVVRSAATPSQLEARVHPPDLLEDMWRHHRPAALEWQRRWRLWVMCVVVLILVLDAALTLLVVVPRLSHVILAHPGG